MAELKNETVNPDVGFMKGIAEKLVKEPLPTAAPKPAPTIQTRWESWPDVKLSDIRLKELTEALKPAATPTPQAKPADNAAKIKDDFGYDKLLNTMMDELDKVFLGGGGWKYPSLTDPYLSPFKFVTYPKGFQMKDIKAGSWNGQQLNTADNSWALAWIKKTKDNFKVEYQVPGSDVQVMEFYPLSEDLDNIKRDVEYFLRDEYGVEMADKTARLRKEIETILQDWNNLAPDAHQDVRGITTKGQNIQIILGENKYQFPIVDLEEASYDGELTEYLREQLVEQLYDIQEEKEFEEQEYEYHTQTTQEKAMYEPKTTRRMVTDHVVDASKMVGAASVQRLLVASAEQLLSPLMNEEQKKLVFESEAGRTIIDLLLPLAVHALGQYETENGRLIPHGEYLERAGDLAFKAQAARYGFQYGDKIAAMLPAFKDQMVTLIASLKQTAVNFPAIAQDLGMDDLGLNESAPAEEITVERKVAREKVIAKTM